MRRSQPFWASYASNRYFLVYGDSLTFVISSKQHFEISIVCGHPRQPGVPLLLYCTIAVLSNATSFSLGELAHSWGSLTIMLAETTIRTVEMSCIQRYYGQLRNWWHTGVLLVKLNGKSRTKQKAVACLPAAVAASVLRNIALRWGTAD